MSSDISVCCQLLLFRIRQLRRTARQHFLVVLKIDARERHRRALQPSDQDDEEMPTNYTPHLAIFRPRHGTSAMVFGGRDLKIVQMD
jgi:hypothetical protein